MLIVICLSLDQKYGSIWHWSYNKFDIPVHVKQDKKNPSNNNNTIINSGDFMYNTVKSI
jgi:hypothetical protein